MERHMPGEKDNTVWSVSILPKISTFQSKLNSLRTQMQKSFKYQLEESTQDFLILREKLTSAATMKPDS